MIGAISPVGSYAGVQRYTQINPVSTHGSTAAAEKSSVIAARKSFDLETPVQPAEAAKPVTSGVSGNLNVDLSVEKSADAAEMAVRMRMSPAEENAEATSVWAEQEAENAERKEQLEAEQKAEAKREAYLDELEEKETAREERIEALKEAQSEDDGSEEQSGALELDHTDAMLRNYQMNNLMQDMLSARTRGKDTTDYSTAIDALLHSGQDRVRFSTEKTESADTRRRYQQAVNDSDSVFGAVA